MQTRRPMPSVTLSLPGGETHEPRDPVRTSERPEGRHPRHAAGAEPVCRHLGEGRRAGRARQRDRHRPYAGTYGFQGHKAAFGARYRHRSGKCRRLHERPHQPRGDSLLPASSSRISGYGNRYPRRYPDRADHAGRGNRTRARRHHSGDWPVTGHAGRHRIRHVRKGVIRQPHAWPADPWVGGQRQRLFPRESSGLHEQALRCRPDAGDRRRCCRS